MKRIWHNIRFWLAIKLIPGYKELVDHYNSQQEIEARAKLDRLCKILEEAKNAPPTPPL